MLPWVARRLLGAFPLRSHHPGAPHSCPACSHHGTSASTGAAVARAAGTAWHWYEHPSTPTPASPRFEKPRAPGAATGSARPLLLSDAFCKVFFRTICRKDTTLLRSYLAQRSPRALRTAPWPSASRLSAGHSGPGAQGRMRGGRPAARPPRAEAGSSRPLSLSKAREEGEHEVTAQSDIYIKQGWQAST